MSRYTQDSQGNMHLIAGYPSSSLTIDSAMSTTSANALQNRVVTNAINSLNDKFTVSTFEVSTSSWSEDTTSQSGTTLYKKAISLSHVYTANPIVKIGAATGYVLPTTDEQAAFDLVLYATLDDTVPALYLYASDIPEDTFYINVEGVD